MLKVFAAGLHFCERSHVDEFAALHHHYRIELCCQLNPSEHPQNAMIFHLLPDVADQTTFAGRIQAR